MKRRTRISMAVLLGLLPLLLGGCSVFSGPQGDPYSSEAYDESIYNDLNLSIDDENGGYNTESENPGFGDPFFSSMFESDQEVNDPMAEEVSEMDEDPASEVYYTHIVWGNLEGNVVEDVMTDWSGQISVDRGAVLIERLIRFEPGQDWIEEREEELWFNLVSETGPDRDGLLLKIIDPEPGSGPNNLSVLLGDLEYSIPVDSLVGYSESVEVGDLGNLFALRSLQQFDCPNGFLRGIWVQRFPGHGIFRGGWLSFDGEVQGHVRGRWGIRSDGSKVMFGKVIDLDGNFQSILRGHWEENEMHPRRGRYGGHWFSPDPEGESSDSLLASGPYWGHYLKGHRRGGFMLGRWLENCE